MLFTKEQLITEKMDRCLLLIQHAIIRLKAFTKYEPTFVTNIEGETDNFLSQ